MGQLMKRVKTKLKTTPSGRELGNLYSRQALYKADKARELLGFQPQVSLDEGLHMCRLWLEYHGYLEQKHQQA